MISPTIFVASWDSGLHILSGEGRHHELANDRIRSLAPDGQRGILAIVGNRTLRRRAASGEWTVIATSDLDLSCCIKVRGTIYVGTDDARLLRVSSGGGKLELLPSFDEVAGRDTWYAGSAVVNGQRVGPPLGIRSITATSDGATLLANVHVGGIPRSSDDGRMWQPTIDIATDVHEVHAHPSKPNAVIAAAGVGLCISNDAGATWKVEHAGLHAPHCSAVQFAGDDILVSASMSPFAPQGALYCRSAHGEGPLVKVRGGLPEWLDGKVDTGCISARENFVAIVDWGGHLYVSDDAGGTWSLRADGMASPANVFMV
jgi:hypothetical protein